MMAPHTVAIIQHLHFHVRVVGMGLARAVAALTGKCLVLVLNECLVFVRVALCASRFARIDRFAFREFRERFSPIPTIFSKGVRSQKITCYRINHHDPQRE